jgi:antitoxin (DNA-binding transcriptional repressor) of toxin-antitoxin stability system
MTITVNKQEFAARLDELLSLVARGDDLLVRDGQAPAIRLTVVEEPKPKRIAGLHAGRGWMSADFDAPLPPEYLPSEE